jgi:molybdate transport system substrate-binding protein
MRIRVAILTIVALLGGTHRPAAAQELTVSAAISTKDAIEVLGRRFTSSRPGLALRYNFGASGVLQKQIEAGAPVDVFVSAAQRQMDELERRGSIVPDTRRIFARNALVAIKPADSAIDLARPTDLLDPRVQKIVIGNPRTVPVGQYAEESLRTLGLWERLQPKLVLAENVRQALDYVTEAFRPGEDTYRPVTYPAAVVKDSRHPALARAFVELLVSADGQAVLGRFGFQPAGGR